MKRFERHFYLKALQMNYNCWVCKLPTAYYNNSKDDDMLMLSQLVSIVPEGQNKLVIAGSYFLNYEL